MKNKIILLNLLVLALLCSCNMNKDKANDTIPTGTDSSMMTKNDSGMNRGNPKPDTAMSHGGAIISGDTSAAKKRNTGTDTSRLKKAAPGQDSMKKSKKG